jgi:hypothetical protein
MPFCVCVVADAAEDSASASRSLASCPPTIAANWPLVRNGVILPDGYGWTRLLCKWYEVGCEAEVEQELRK